MNNVYMLTIEDYCKIVEKALADGVKPGESLEKQFLEYMNSNQGNVEFLGISEKDADLLTGEARDLGMKVFNMKEFERQNGNK